MARIYEVNERVVMVDDGTIRHGVITQVFERIPSVVIVKFDDGEVEKVNPQRLAVMPVEKKEEPKVEETKTETKTEKTITISESEFTEKMAKMTVDNFILKKDAPPEALILCTLFVTMAHTALFDESEDNA